MNVCVEGHYWIYTVIIFWIWVLICYWILGCSFSCIYICLEFQLPAAPLGTLWLWHQNHHQHHHYHHHHRHQQHQQHQHHGQHHHNNHGNHCLYFLNTVFLISCFNSSMLPQKAPQALGDNSLLRDFNGILAFEETMGMKMAPLLSWTRWPFKPCCLICFCSIYSLGCPPPSQQ